MKYIILVINYNNMSSEQVVALFPHDFELYTVECKALVTEYLIQLSPFDKKACAIAKNHLETSYDILLSNGYNTWLKAKLNKV